ncbi:helix-turn-helix domain-containing protein [Parapedobacter sp. 2B3]|uniref:AraC family transcriptional regulator n=1 Tax=Parapedobacter sp. 2B3 TaxID=3342381 RepID=UPI0035B64A61
MPEKNLLHRWRETVSSRPGTRDSFNGMHLAVLHQTTRRKLDQRLSLIQFETPDFMLCELKGRPLEMMAFALPATDTEVLWLCLQFHGKVSFPDGHVSQPETLFSFATGANDYPLTLAAEKQWVLLLGLSGPSRQLLLAELAPLREQHDGPQNDWAAYAITFADRRHLDAFSKLTFGPFTTPHHIGQLLAHLYGAYAQQLEKPREPGGEQALMLLYHQVVAYIQRHYMDEGLNRETVAAECNCSVRQLNRAFEGRSVTFNTAIRTLRLHKARELLRKKPELSVEEVAVILQFPNGKHFATQYRKQFHRSPREERKAILPRK